MGLWHLDGIRELALLRISTFSRWQPPALADEACDQSGVFGPSVENDITWDLACGVAEHEGDNDDVVERSDDWQELGYEVDGRDDPYASDEDGDPHPPWNPRVLSQRAVMVTQAGRKAARSRSGPLGRCLARSTRINQDRARPATAMSSHGRSEATARSRLGPLGCGGEPGSDEADGSEAEYGEAVFGVLVC